MSRREKSCVAFWAAAAAVLAVLYVTSFGPACWIQSRRGGSLALNSVYLPIGWAFANAPRILSGTLQSYARLGMKPGSLLLLTYRREGFFVLGPNDPFSDYD